MIARSFGQARQLVLIFGGPGPEHEVGLASALSVREHLTNRWSWTPFEAGVTKDGRWLVGTGALQMLLGAADPARLPAGLDKAAAGLAMGVDSTAVRSFGGPPPCRDLCWPSHCFFRLVTGNGGRGRCTPGCWTPTD